MAYKLKGVLVPYLFVISVVSASFLALVDTVYNAAVETAYFADVERALNYFAVNALADFIVCLVVAVFATAVISVVRSARKDTPVVSGRVFAQVAGLTLVLPFSLVFLTIMNLDFIRDLFSREGLLVNALAAVLIFFLGVAVIYFSGRASRVFDATGFRAVLVFIASVGGIGAGVGLVRGPGSNVPDYPDIEGAPNVIIISMDAFRRDRMSCYGSDRVKTPNFDRFAARAYLFTDAYANAPWTIPSLSTMNTGLYPSVVRANFTTDLAPGILRLAEVLKSHGYRTEAYNANVLASAERGFDRGYDVYMEFGDIKPLLFFKNSTVYRAVKRSKTIIEKLARRPRDETEWCKSNLLNSLEAKRPGKPLFVWVHFLDPHTPMTPPPEYIEGDEDFVEDARVFGLTRTRGAVRVALEDLDMYRALYEAEVRYLDDVFGEILAYFDERRIWKDSVVVITADHAEEFYEHGYIGHGKSHYSTVLAVPLIIFLPGDEGGRVIDTPASLIDIPVTVLDFVGAEPLPGAFGTSLIPYISGGAPGNRYLFFDGTRPGRPLFSVYDGTYHLIRFGTAEKGFKYELYNVESDPLEQNDLAEAPEYAAVVARLTKRLEAEKAKIDDMARKFGPAEPGRLTAEAREKLKDLGYMK